MTIEAGPAVAALAEPGARRADGEVSPRARAAEGVAVAVVCVLALLVYGSFGRPIWIDEFLHFALGSHRSFREAWDTISVTTVATNHGQTGVYMILDYALLRAFGASAVALRLPSLACSVLLLVSAAMVLRHRRLGLGWQLLALTALLGQTRFMYFVGEARPYMPLAAASVGTLAYYLAPPEERTRTTVRWLGIASILLGALMHPYFPVYAVSLCGFAYLLAVAEGTRAPGWSSLRDHVNVPLAAVAAMLFVSVGAATWMRGGPTFDVDPYQWIRHDGLYWTFAFHHAQFLGDARDAVLALVVASALAFAVLRGRWRTLLRPLVAPAVLLVLALGVSLLLSYLSYRRHYWVLPRQWVASMALVPLAVVWWGAALAASLGTVRRSLAALVPAILVLLVGAYSAKAFAGKAREALALARRPHPAPASIVEVRQAPTEPDRFVELANRNIEAGGRVWDVFRAYYGK